MTECMNDQFATAGFWQQVYAAGPESRDWLVAAEEFDWAFEWTLPSWDFRSQARVLDIGCGTSAVLLRLYEQGWGSLLGLDFNAAVVEWCRARVSAISPAIEYQQAEAHNLRLRAGSFTHVFDKALLDCVLSGYDATFSAQKYLRGVWEVLVPQGWFICVSLGAPERRLPHLTPLEWDVRTAQLWSPKEAVYVYLCQKRGGG